jgi:hypothetical protein
MSVLRISTGCLALVAVFATQAQAEIVTPVTATASSQFAGSANLVNGSGLSGVGPILGQLHNNDENAMWQTFASSSVGESVVFELDKAYDLSAAHVWQYNGPAGPDKIPVPQREVENIDIAISPDLVSPFVSLGTKTLNPALDPTVATFNEPVQSIPLAGSNVARRVRFTIQSVHSPPSDGFAGLSEVRFEGTVIPEPAALALIGLGLGTLAVRRRRSAV